MSRWRRSAWVVFYCHDGRSADLAALLQGRAEVQRRSQLYAISVLTGREHPISRDQLEAILSVPADRWVEEEALPAPASSADLRALAETGTVLSDDPSTGPLADLRHREEELSAAGWNVYGALSHFMTKWSGVDLRVPGDAEDDLSELPTASEEEFQAYVKRFGPPPSAFASVGRALGTFDLPRATLDRPLAETLNRRRTTRAFDPETPITLDKLAVVLGEVFGAHGYAGVIGGHFALRKTSPSGGALHPIEAYPVVTAVEGLEPGLYHYSVGHHSLELLEPIAPDDGREFASRCVCGQSYFGAAGVSVLLTARFERMFWKYRNHQRALAAILLEAGHFSQTLYLVCAELDLGAYVTTAVNGADIERRLDIDGVREGALAVCGFGSRGSDSRGLEPEFLPYVPRETAL